MSTPSSANCFKTGASSRSVSWPSVSSTVRRAFSEGNTSRVASSASASRVLLRNWSSATPDFHSPSRVRRSSVEGICRTPRPTMNSDQLSPGRRPLIHASTWSSDSMALSRSTDSETSTRKFTCSASFSCRANGRQTATIKKRIAAARKASDTPPQPRRPVDEAPPRRHRDQQRHQREPHERSVGNEFPHGFSLPFAGGKAPTRPRARRSPAASATGPASGRG